MRTKLQRILFIMLLLVGLTACSEGASSEKKTGAAQERNTEEEGAVETAQSAAPESEQDVIPDTDGRELLPAVDFTGKDQYGNTHTLSGYKGKVVFLNFWATWCPPCRAEMPDMQKLYEEYREKGDDSVVILGVAAPGYGQEVDEQGVKDFLEENGYTYPVIMDPSGEVMVNYYITAFPTTYMIDTEGNVFGYVTGQLSEGFMRDIIRQTKESKKDS